MSRKMVLFVPRPWYRRCCWHITDRLPSVMPCYRDRARCQPPSYFKPTWWAHNPQFHRIETWLSCTPCSQGCSSRVASYIIHDHLPRDHQFWYQTQYLSPLLWTPFMPCFRHRTIAYPVETSRDTFLLCSQCVSFLQLERYSCVHSWDTPEDFPI